MNTEDFMRLALEQAQEAYALQEVPIGAVVVYKNEVIGRGHNLREDKTYVHAHAEIMAMNEAAAHLKTWNLEGCTLYVTVEPCPMCAGAVMQTHLTKVVYGTTEPNSGSYQSVFNINAIDGFNHYPEVWGGVLAQESSDLIKKFFREKRLSAIHVKRVDAQKFAEYMNVRMRVFVDEQHVAKNDEIDSFDVLDDPNVVHVCAVYQDKIIASARYIRHHDTYKIGRVAVLKEHRGSSVGKKMMKYIEKQAVNNGVKRLVLGAQLWAIPFYEKNGFRSFGETFDDAGIEHINMIKHVKTPIQG